MTLSRGRRSRQPERSQYCGKISNGQRKFIRKLICVLADVIDEKEDFENNEVVQVEDVKGILPDEHCGPLGETEYPETVKDPHPKVQYPEPKDVANIVHFKELCNAQRQLISQIQSSLKALGGGDRTAKALEDMHTGTVMITEACSLRDIGPVLDPQCCFSAFAETYHAASKVIDSFRELGVFNITFFETSETLIDRLKAIERKLEVEYGSDENYGLIVIGNASNYINFLWGELDLDFKAFLDQLTAIAEKEIATIRQTQDFLSQRYLNLTTVATFLSSVTATTLQTTSSDPASTLEALINTLWFLSLVFSTASAVYSLLIMTWRQSSVRQPEKSLPSWVHSWIRNGPMYALIIAVSTFSIGLCLLAFDLLGHQGRLASAIVPTAFAGLHAYTIVIVSTYFLSEQWKERHRKSWGRLIVITQAVTDKAKGYGSRLKGTGSQIKQQIQLIYTSLSIKTTKLSGPTNDEKNDTDIELGKAKSVKSPESSPLDLEVNQQALPEYSSSDSEKVEDVEPESILAIPQDSTSSAEADLESHNDAQSVIRRDIPLERLLEFSPNGRLLTHGFSNKLITYIQGYYDYIIYHTYSLPKGDRVLQVTWSPKNELLVRTSRKLFLWTDTRIKDEHFGEPSVISFEQHTVAARWLHAGTNGISVFFCALGSVIKSFNTNCEELRLFDLSEMLRVEQVTILDFAFVGAVHMLCLATRPAEGQGWQLTVDSPVTTLLVINMDNGTVESDHPVETGHTYLAVSEKTRSVLMHGASGWAKVFSVEASATTPLQLRENTYIFSVRGGGIFNFYERGTGIIIKASEGEVRLLYQLYERDRISTLHSFTMQNEKANAPNPTCFAINQAFGPYMFAFGDESGSVYIWSIQRNQSFPYSKLVESSNVEDRPAGRQEPIISSGRFMILFPSEETWIDAC